MKKSAYGGRDSWCTSIRVTADWTKSCRANAKDQREVQIYTLFTYTRNHTDRFTLVCFFLKSKRVEIFLQRCKSSNSLYCERSTSTRRICGMIKNFLIKSCNWKSVSWNLFRIFITPTHGHHFLHSLLSVRDTNKWYTVSLPCYIVVSYVAVLARATTIQPNVSMELR